MPIRFDGHLSRLAQSFNLSQMKGCIADLLTVSNVCRSLW